MSGKKLPFKAATESATLIQSPDSIEKGSVIPVACPPEREPNPAYKREHWSRGVEFLFSCIAMSVGLGNLWRFPFVAYKNGGGAFLIPYIIVLFIIGKPGYFLEMALGQFASRGTIKVYDCAPIMRGVGTGQVLSSMFVMTYYSSIMGLSLKYLFDSFKPDLPWSICQDDWGNCVPAVREANMTYPENSSSSAEIYFNKAVYNHAPFLEGVFDFNWNLVAFLATSWFIVFLIVAKGVKSSGKCSYLLAIFPYIMLGIFLIKALTLEGAMDGISYFFKPQWEKILEPGVWYAAVTQVFFSLNVYFANVIMYSSYNKFRHNVYRDSNIVTTMDTFTSILAGCCVFATLGHLKHQLGVDHIDKVMSPGPGVAFISYPETIAKFKSLSRVYSVAFFLMLYVLGIGSNVAQTSCVVTEIRDHFKKVTNWQAALGVATCGTILGSFYMTRSGLNLLSLVDHYGATFIAFNLVIFELGTFCYIYGVERICKDIEFMLGFRPNLYWRTCWKYLTPGMTAFLVAYYYWDFHSDVANFPTGAHLFGILLTFVGLVQLPALAIYQVYKSDGATLIEKIKTACRPLPSWGPREEKLHAEYLCHLRDNNIAF